MICSPQAVVQVEVMVLKRRKLSEELRHNLSAGLDLVGELTWVSRANERQRTSSRSVRLPHVMQDRINSAGCRITVCVFAWGKTLCMTLVLPFFFHWLSSMFRSPCCFAQYFNDQSDRRDSWQQVRHCTRGGQRNAATCANQMEKERQPSESGIFGYDPMIRLSRATFISHRKIQVNTLLSQWTIFERHYRQDSMSILSHATRRYK